MDNLVKYNTPFGVIIIKRNLDIFLNGLMQSHAEKLDDAFIKVQELFNIEQRALINKNELERTRLINKVELIKTHIGILESEISDIESESNNLMITPMSLSIEDYLI